MQQSKGMIFNPFNTKQIIVIASFIFLCLVWACETPSPNLSRTPAPTASDLGHIDLILDEATWHAIKTDSFMKSEFGVLNVDTGQYGGKPSYDLYLLGHYSFLHLSLAKGFWENQQKGGAIVFQTQKPGQKDALLKSWKEFYNDSLLIHTFKGTDFTLDEILTWYKTDSTKPKQASMFADLTSYSAEAYKNWGITDSVVEAGLAMKQFMGDWGGEPLKSRLFHSLEELYMTVNQREFKEVRTALLSVGYMARENIFTHPANPQVFITVDEEKGKPKYSKVKFKLNRSIQEREIVFSPMAKLQLGGMEAWLILN